MQHRIKRVRPFASLEMTCAGKLRTAVDRQHKNAYYGTHFRFRQPPDARRSTECPKEAYLLL
ncbi:MAG: hypothetical protein DME33_04885 [Verrucomicrobia bacterium]|nr:MAG: hypothetical protein DME33_04885 [Verrucomicrobiota bacterium]